MLTTIDASRPELPLPTDTRPSRPRWFAAGGYVIRQGSRCEVHVGGLLVGVFDVEDHARRNLLLVTLAESPSMHLSQLAAAFEVSVETSRALRRQAEREGIAGVGRTLRAGAKSKLTAKQLAKARSLLDEGASADGLRRRFPGKISIRTAQRIRSEWLKAGRARSQPSGPGDGTSIEASGSPSSGDSAGTSVEAITDAVRDALAKSEIEKADVGDVASATAGVTSVISDMADRPATKEIDPDVAPQDDERNASVICGEPTDEAPDPSTTPPAAREILDDARGNAATSVRSARGVQYLGTWLMMAMLSTWKLHDRIGVLGNGTAKATGSLRVALDAVIAALSIGERCVEGVRRLKTRTASALLRCTWAPSASWTRQVLHGISGLSAERILPVVMARDYIAAARSGSAERAVFYVDNHVRPYTGDRVVRKAWRMQDKRARPGSTDFYVHDEDGRPLYRVTAPSNPSLTALLVPVARDLKALCGSEARPLLCFDRGGAFAQEMAALRDLDVDFVTYERKPYPVLPTSRFDQSVVIDGERIGWTESRINLGKGRGRVRRISLRMPDERQVNLLAVGRVDAPRLVDVLGSRWLQENGFKHGVERWGINQLDGRKTEPYAADTIIPNPARRRLERALKAACIQEGRARRELSRAKTDSTAFRSATEDLQSSLDEQARLLTLRPTTPTHAPVVETELAGVLVKHAGEYKALIDTIRIACANVEADLAAILRPHLPRPAEAKKALANLFAAPGHIHAASDRIRITLEPAGTAPELAAFEALLVQVNARKLNLPGDRGLRRLEFQLQK